MNFDYIIPRVSVINIKNLEYVDMQWTTKHDDFNKRYSGKHKETKKEKERINWKWIFSLTSKWRFFNFYVGIDKANSFCMELELFRGAKATNFKMVFVGFIYF